ncbi:MAG: NAD(P)H-dependent glycerol-3-phosphate dehydrogenase [Verrucomicrobiales bacterium]
MNISILGAGGWGTALALVLHANKHRITLWGHNPAHLLEIEKARRNERYLPEAELPGDFIYEPDLQQAIHAAAVIVIAAPSKGFADIAHTLRGSEKLVVSVTKGIEYETGETMSAVLKRHIPNAKIGALSGPTLAPEVARGIPSAIVAAGDSLTVATEIQELFHRPAFRVYTSSDMAGVELGGALKNVIAIAAGVGDGLGFGDNTKAALITRAIAEIRRLGTACLAQPETFAGLSGLGDLTVTCFSRLSRNRTFGERLGRGESVQQILASARAVAEGYPTARSAFKLAKDKHVETPIIDEVYAMLYEGKNIRQAVIDLTNRSSKAED